MTHFNDSTPMEKIKILRTDKQLAFIILLCERMIPALKHFATDTRFNDSFYQECLGNAWRCLEQSTSRFPDAATAAARCFSQAPDTENFGHPLTSAALNATLAIGAMMIFLADNNVDHIVEAATLARDTAAAYAQDIVPHPPRSLNFTEIMQHPLVQQELRRQAEDLQFLESIPPNEPHTAALVKEHSRQSPGATPSDG